jgi:hypothetical protein
MVSDQKCEVSAAAARAAGDSDDEDSTLLIRRSQALQPLEHRGVGPPQGWP